MTEEKRSERKSQNSSKEKQTSRKKSESFSSSGAKNGSGILDFEQAAIMMGMTLEKQKSLKTKQEYQKALKHTWKKIVLVHHPDKVGSRKKTTTTEQGNGAVENKNTDKNITQNSTQDFIQYKKAYELLADHYEDFELLYSKRQQQQQSSSTYPGQQQESRSSNSSGFAGQSFSGYHYNDLWKSDHLSSDDEDNDSDSNSDRQRHDVRKPNRPLFPGKTTDPSRNGGNGQMQKFMDDDGIPKHVKSRPFHSDDGGGKMDVWMQQKIASQPLTPPLFVTVRMTDELFLESLLKNKGTIECRYQRKSWCPQDTHQKYASTFGDVAYGAGGNQPDSSSPPLTGSKSSTAGGGNRGTNQPVSKTTEIPGAPCEPCKGKGWHLITDQNHHHHHVGDEVLCLKCGGGGKNMVPGTWRTKSLKCPRCNGYGQVTKEKKVGSFFSEMTNQQCEVCDGQGEFPPQEPPSQKQQQKNTNDSTALPSSETEDDHNHSEVPSVPCPTCQQPSRGFPGSINEPCVQVVSLVHFFKLPPIQGFHAETPCYSSIIEPVTLQEQGNVAEESQGCPKRGHLIIHIEFSPTSKFKLAKEGPFFALEADFHPMLVQINQRNTAENNEWEFRWPMFFPLAINRLFSSVSSPQNGGDAATCASFSDGLLSPASKQPMQLYFSKKQPSTIDPNGENPNRKRFPRHLDMFPIDLTPLCQNPEIYPGSSFLSSTNTDATNRNVAKKIICMVILKQKDVPPFQFPHLFPISQQPSTASPLSSPSNDDSSTASSSSSNQLSAQFPFEPISYLYSQQEQFLLQKWK